MPRQERLDAPFRSLLRALCASVLGGLASLPALAQSAAAPELREDAELADVFFLDLRRGWAVGDRGVIWKTEDGGRQWRQQPSPVDCRLESVFFLDERLGWAVGGFAQPHTHRSHGVTLRTQDGGYQWEIITAPALPKLRRIRMIDPRRGWALGDASAMHASGLFHTSDGGRSWLAVAPTAHGAWRAGELGVAGQAILARDDAVVQLQGARVFPAATPAGRGGIRQLKMLDDAFGWLVGDDGLALATADGGSTWLAPPFPLPPVARRMDLRALAVWGDHVWLAGSPGSVVLHSADGGQSWDVSPTGHFTPIVAMTFVSATHGWAVGSLGAILATHDGGKSWHIQRRGGERLAVLSLASRPSQAPWELLTLLCLEQDGLGRLEVAALEGNHSIACRPADPEERLHQAAVAVGAGGASMARLSTAHAEEAVEALARRWTRLIRQWRPEMVVIDGGGAGDDALGPIARQAAWVAQARAADASFHSPELADMRLPPWNARRVLAPAAPERAVAFTVAASQIAHRAAGSLGDAALEPRALVRESDELWPAAADELRFELVAGQPLPVGRGDPLRDADLAGARRRAPPAVSAKAGALQQMSLRAGNLQRLLTSEISEQKADAWLAQIGPLVRSFEPQAAALLLWQVAGRRQAIGRSDLAAEVLRLLAREYPQSPQAEAALVWLVHYGASQEPGAREPPIRASLALEAGKAIAARHPDLAVEPAVRLALAAAHRATSATSEVERLCNQVAAAGMPEPWRTCAKAEQWLLRPGPAGPKPFVRCPRAKAKPRLDGQLDDPLWSQAAQLPLSAAGDAVALIAWDDEFLYLAARCPKAPHLAYSTDDGPRPRDGDLRGQDRVELLLDTNRDYTSWLCLSVDHRGWPAESSLGIVAWDPQWFVAAQCGDEAWAFEAAIPWSEAPKSRPTPGAAWAVSARRIIPQRDTQSWPPDAPAKPLGSGFGLLLFE